MSIKAGQESGGWVATGNGSAKSCSPPIVYYEFRCADMRVHQLCENQCEIDFPSLDKHHPACKWYVMRNTDKKKSPLETLLSGHPNRFSEPDSIQAADEELAIKTKLCDVFVEFQFGPGKNRMPTLDETNRFVEALESYRDWQIRHGLIEVG